MNLSKLQSEAVKEIDKMFTFQEGKLKGSSKPIFDWQKPILEKLVSDQIQKAYSKGREEENKKLRDASSYIFDLEIPEHDVRIDLEFRPQIRAMCVADQLKCQIITAKLEYWTKVWTWKLEKRLKKQIDNLSIQSKEK
jgi:hypothetical protein